MDPTFVHKPAPKQQWSNQGWAYDQWESTGTPWVRDPWRDRSQSPHPHRQTPPSPRQVKGGGKGKGKGKQPKHPKNPKGKGKGKQNANQTVNPVANQEPAWQTPATPSNTSAAASSTAQPDPDMQGLLRELKKQSGTLSPEIQSLLTKVTTVSSQQATKELHNQVTRLGNAKKQLQMSIEARTKLHREWQKYISDAVVRWEGYVKSFETEDARIEDELQKARAGLIQAKEDLEAAKKAATSINLQVAETEEAEEDVEMLAQMASGRSIQENMTQMISTFKEIHKRAVAESEEAPASKQPRTDKTESPEPKEEVSTDGATEGRRGWQQPFGAPAKQTQ